MIHTLVLVTKAKAARRHAYAHEPLLRGRGCRRRNDALVLAVQAKAKAFWVVVPAALLHLLLVMMMVGKDRHHCRVSMVDTSYVL